MIAADSFTNEPEPASQRLRKMDEIKAEFAARNEQWENKVDSSKLNEEEVEIRARHAEACKEFKLSYSDPRSKAKVMTRWRHFLRGSCCGSACRHCVYQHEKVQQDIRVNRTFNSAFWKNK